MRIGAIVTPEKINFAVTIFASIVGWFKLYIFTFYIPLYYFLYYRELYFHRKRNDFSPSNLRSFFFSKLCQVKRMTAIEAMVKTKCYICLCHPVCRKFLKAKWMDFGWKVHVLSLFLYLIFLIALNIYAFQIPAYQYTQNNPGKIP